MERCGPSLACPGGGGHHATRGGDRPDRFRAAPGKGTGRAVGASQASWYPVLPGVAELTRVPLVEFGRKSGDFRYTHPPSALPWHERRSQIPSPLTSEQHTEM